MFFSQKITAVFFFFRNCKKRQAHARKDVAALRSMVQHAKAIGQAKRGTLVVHPRVKRCTTWVGKYNYQSIVTPRFFLTLRFNEILLLIFPFCLQKIQDPSAALAALEDLGAEEVGNKLLKRGFKKVVGQLFHVISNGWWFWNVHNYCMFHPNLGW